MNCIKVCGMKDAKNIREVENLGIDMMGFICWEGSPRYVSKVPTYLPKCLRVGVFVNPSLNEILKRTETFNFSYIQLHGSESPEFCQEVRKRTDSKVIKAISISAKEDLVLANQYEGFADLLLFDTKGKSVGGNGQKFDWSILEDYHGDTPFLLSGGIGPEDAELLRHWHHPQCIGFDINSRFELEPSIKDTEKIKSFISAIRQHESN